MAARHAGWTDGQAARIGSRREELESEAAGPATPAGSLAEYVARFRARGVECAISADGTEAWVPGARRELQRLPLACTADVDRAWLRDLLRRPGIWVVSYQLDGRQSHPVNCVLYLCRDPSYSIEGMPRNARRDVRRGQRNFSIRPSRWSEVAERGFRAEADTAARHGYRLPSLHEFKRWMGRLQDSARSEVWGAWRGDELAAWTSVVKIDDWAMINIARSCTAALTLCPNNALLYAATRQLLVAEKCRYVTYGLSSVQLSGRDLSMHRFKVRMGYEAVPLHRRFVIHPLLRRLVTSRLMSWSWDQLAHVFPQSANLQRVAGMARLLSGRDLAPLRWLDEPPGVQ